jgi:hypothetical protein
MADLATVKDIESLVRPLTTAETVQAAFLLEVASGMVRDRFTTIDDRITSGDISGRTVAYAVAEMVVAVLDGRATPRGAGVVSHSETVGPYTESTSYDKNAATGLDLSDAIAARLMPRQGAGVGSIHLDRPYYVSPYSPAARRAQGWR